MRCIIEASFESGLATIEDESAHNAIVVCKSLMVGNKARGMWKPARYPSVGFFDVNSTNSYSLHREGRGIERYGSAGSGSRV